MGTEANRFFRDARPYNSGMRKYHYLIFFVFVCAAVPARATDLTLFGGIQKPGKLTVQSVTNTAVTLDPPTFGMYGLRLSYGRVFGTEETLAYNPRFISSSSHAVIYTSNFIVHIPLPRVRPYATIGLGGAFVGGGPLQTLKGSKLALNYGGGLKVKLAGPLGAQFDARGYRYWGFQGRQLNAVEVSIGVMLAF